MDRRYFTPATLGMAMTGSAPAQTTSRWSPSKPVRIISSAAGGIPDVVARQLAEQLAPALGQAVIVENKPGAGSIVAMEAARTSAPDGHTLAITTFVEMTINPWLCERLSYDPVKDFAPVTVLYAGPILLVAHPSFPGETLADLTRLAKAQPGKYLYGSPDMARPPHIWVERFKHTAGIDIGHVPFKGGAPLAHAVLAGDVMLGMEGAPPRLPHVKAGKLKALAVTGDRRLAALPDVPTFAEAGVPGIGLTWVGIVAPAGTPTAAVERIQQEIGRALQSPQIRAAHEQAGRTVVGNSPQASAALIAKELPEWRAIVKATSMRPE